MTSCRVPFFLLLVQWQHDDIVNVLQVEPVVKIPRHTAVGFRSPMVVDAASAKIGEDPSGCHLELVCPIIACGTVMKIGSEIHRTNTVELVLDELHRGCQIGTIG